MYLIIKPKKESSPRYFCNLYILFQLKSAFIYNITTCVPLWEKNKKSADMRKMSYYDILRIYPCN